MELKKDGLAKMSFKHYKRRENIQFSILNHIQKNEKINISYFMFLYFFSFDFYIFFNIYLNFCIL
jgi:hypothetical protein